MKRRPGAKKPVGVAVLGSTGSIGKSALEVIRRHPERFRVVALAAGSDVEGLKRQVEEFKPRFVSVSTPEAASRLPGRSVRGVEVGVGTDGASHAAVHDGVDAVVSAISGAAGLLPTYAAVRAGKTVALANKETLVMAGPLVMAEARRRGAVIMPVDSEHSAIHQSLAGHRREDVVRVILTASGGPFWRTPKAKLRHVTPKEALNHPKWKMGRKITVDSATLMNKGLEVIEARWLFDLTIDRISVCVHPEAVVHSMVEYRDGSIVAQLGTADMKGPIAYALSCPERIETGAAALKLAGLKFGFYDPDPDKFPCLALAYDALRAGGTAPAALNAADEVAVEEFLGGSLPFTSISRVIERVLAKWRPRPVDSIGAVIEADGAARELARSEAARLGRRSSAKRARARLK